MSTTTNSIVSFEPASQLVFQKTEQEGSLETSVVQDTLKITNLTADQDILFRVQTTAPLTYRVKPSHGRITVGESAIIHVVMVADSTKVDKFLIKYAPISPSVSNEGNFLELFKTVENNISEHRLKCSILQPDGSPMVHISAQNASQQDFSPLLTSEVPTGSPVISEDSEPVKSEPQVVPAAAIEPPQPQQPVTPTTSPTKPKVIDPKDAKLQTLQARNQDLQRQVEELQKLVAKSTGSAAAINQPPPEWVALLNSQTGFPPVLVILIALFSFLVGLLF